MNVPSHRAFGIWVLVEVEQIAVFDRLDRLVHVIECDLIQRLCDGNAACPSGDLDQPCVFQLRQNFTNDNRIGVDRSGEEIARDLVFILEDFYAGEDMQRYRKSACDLDKPTPPPAVILSQER